MELHMSHKVVSKGDRGRTACGSAAYRSCSRIVDNDGIVHDYDRKVGHVAGGIELPQGAPMELKDPQTLWQRHELKDVRKDAQLFREIDMAFPNEFSYSSCERLLRTLCSKLTEKGMCVQWDIHDVTNKDGQRNLHSHLMVTMRELMPDGSFGNKNRTWNKFNGGLNIAEILRPEAARLMNEELARIGSIEHVEHESYANRGIDKIPTTHVGVAATAMESKGEVTDRGTNRRYIEWLNEIHEENIKESRASIRRLDALIRKAKQAEDGNEVYKEWDAMFAYLRDIRRGRAAIAGELKRLDKVAACYQDLENTDNETVPVEQNEARRKKARDYLIWAGCDPDNPAQEVTIDFMRTDIRKEDEQLALAERMMLKYKGILKAHNKTIYTSNKVQWDQYQLDRSKRSINYFIRRLKNLDAYIRYIKQTVSVFDVIFQTAEYEQYRAKLDELETQRGMLTAKYLKTREEIEQHKMDLKQHKKEAKEAVKATKKIGKFDGQDNEDR